MSFTGFSMNTEITKEDDQYTIPKIRDLACAGGNGASLFEIDGVPKRLAANEPLSVPLDVRPFWKPIQLQKVYKDCLREE